MRVLFVNTYYYPNMFGGAEKAVKLLASKFAEKCPCAVFSADSAVKGLHKEVIEGVEIFRSGSFFFDFEKRFSKRESRFCKLKNRLADLYNPAANRHFKKVIKEFKPDVIHTNGLRGIGPQIWKIAQKNGIKVVHTLHDYFASDPLMREEPPASTIISAWQSYWNSFSKCIDAVTAPSTYVINKMQKNGFAKNSIAFTIPNGISFTPYQPSCDENKNIQTKNTKVRFIFAGTLVDFKGILKLLEAFKDVQKHQPNVELVICGAGPLQGKIQEESSQNPAILYRGKLDAESIAKEYQQADICVIPSLWEEPFGLVVIEAAYYGCALIASNKGGIPEIINSLGAGILCDCSNTHVLAKNMIDLCDENARSTQQKKFATTISKYSIDKCIDTHYNFFAKVLNG